MSTVETVCLSSLSLNKTAGDNALIISCVFFKILFRDTRVSSDGFTINELASNEESFPTESVHV